MALKKTITFAGVQVTDAYHRVEGFNVRRNWEPDINGDVGAPQEVASAIDIRVRSYIDSKAVHDIGERIFMVSCERANPASFAGCYVALKTLPEFAGAEDC